MRATSLLLLALCLLPVQVWAQAAYDPDVLRRCQSFNECTLIWNGCTDQAVNKQFVDAIKQATVCGFATEHNPRALPTCTDGICVVVVPEKTK